MFWRQLNSRFGYGQIRILGSYIKRFKPSLVVRVPRTTREGRKKGSMWWLLAPTPPAGAHLLFLLGRNGHDGSADASPDPLLLAPDPISLTHCTLDTTQAGQLRSLTLAILFTKHSTGKHTHHERILVAYDSPISWFSRRAWLAPVLGRPGEAQFFLAQKPIARIKMILSGKTKTLTGGLHLE